MNTATEKFNKNYVESVKPLEKNFSDMKAGQRMLISSPKSIANYINNIPYGAESNIKDMRLELAKASKAHNTCPLTTGIFLRIAIEYSLEEACGLQPTLPFWRLITHKSPVAKKVPLSLKYIEEMRVKEGLAP